LYSNCPRLAHRPRARGAAVVTFVDTFAGEPPRTSPDGIAPYPSCSISERPSADEGERWCYKLKNRWGLPHAGSIPVPGAACLAFGEEPPSPRASVSIRVSSCDSLSGCVLPPREVGMHAHRDALDRLAVRVAPEMVRDILTVTGLRRSSCWDARVRQFGSPQEGWRSRTKRREGSWRRALDLY